jgi:cytidylate kinase
MNSKKHIITLGGFPGSGKSSTAKAVALILGYQQFSSGDFWREVAQSRGLNVAELSKRAESDPSIDKLIDDAVRSAGAKSDIVIDSRLAFHWIPDAFKVFLHIDPHTASQRIFEHMQRVGRVGETAESVEATYQAALERIKSENLRYKELYGVSYVDESQYDLVVDTTTRTLNDVADVIVKTYKGWLQS